MDMIREIRRRAGRIKAGHAGTLDPLATGVLVCCLGKATKLVETLMASGKEYVTSIDLSAFTTTDDAEGERTEVTVEALPSIEAVSEACAQFTGMIEQANLQCGKNRWQTSLRTCAQWRRCARKK